MRSTRCVMRVFKAMQFGYFLCCLAFPARTSTMMASAEVEDVMQCDRLLIYRESLMLEGKSKEV